MSSQTIITGFDPEGLFAGLILPPAFIKRQSETRFKQEWRLTLAQYAALMNSFKGPKRQRGSYYANVLKVLSSAAGTVVITNHSFLADEFSPGSVTSAVQFRNNGQLWELDNGFGSDTEQNGEWWSDEPEASIGDGYEVRALSGGSGTWGAAAAADNVWITITVSRTWSVTETTPVSTTFASRTFEVGLDGVESALDSAVISCRASLDL